MTNLPSKPWAHVKIKHNTELLPLLMHVLRPLREYIFNSPTAGLDITLQINICTYTISVNCPKQKARHLYVSSFLS